MDDLSEVFDAVAAYFSLLAEPARLRIMHSICENEKTVTQILADVGGTQANVSRHLTLMYRSGALARRKEGSMVYYRVADNALVDMCRNVCGRVADKMEKKGPLRRRLNRLMPQRATDKRAE